MWPASLWAGHTRTIDNMGYQQGSIRAVDTDYDVEWLEQVDYMEMWHRQAEYAQQRADAAVATRDEPDRGVDKLLFLETPRRTQRGNEHNPKTSLTMTTHRSSASTGVGASPGTGQGSWSGTRSFG